MNISKNQVIDVLRERNQSARADWVDRELPDVIELSRHSGVLTTLGIDLADVAAKDR